MGQAFRRATGRIGSSNVDAASSQLKKPIDRRPPLAAAAIKTPSNNVAPVAGMPFLFLPLQYQFIYFNFSFL